MRRKGVVAKNSERRDRCRFAPSRAERQLDEEVELTEVCRKTLNLDPGQARALSNGPTLVP